MSVQWLAKGIKHGCTVYLHTIGHGWIAYSENLANVVVLKIPFPLEKTEEHDCADQPLLVDGLVGMGW